MTSSPPRVKEESLPSGSVLQGNTGALLSTVKAIDILSNKLLEDIPADLGIGTVHKLTPFD